jgi:hypothetical protein
MILRKLANTESNLRKEYIQEQRNERMALHHYEQKPRVVGMQKQANQESLPRQWILEQQL